PALVKVVPVPWISVLTVSLLSGFAFGMVTLGAVPNDPVAVTEPPLAPALADDDAAGLEEPQAARARQAIRGIAMSASKRRMKTSMVVDVSQDSLLARPSSLGPRAKQRAPVAQALADR